MRPARQGEAPRAAERRRLACCRLAPQVGILKSFLGLSASLYTGAYVALLAPHAEDFLLMVALVPPALVGGDVEGMWGVWGAGGGATLVASGRLRCHALLPRPGSPTRRRSRRLAARRLARRRCCCPRWSTTCPSSRRAKRPLRPASRRPGAGARCTG
jgi:hypothetical protein